MTVRNRTKKALAMLLPAGVLGMSAALAAMLPTPSPVDRRGNQQISGVADRLREIRTWVSDIDQKKPDETLVADWWNGRGWGWRNGGWGWHNGGWRNGGWGNGGWGNGIGWGNGGRWPNWHNFWRNW